MFRKVLIIDDDLLSGNLYKQIIVSKEISTQVINLKYVTQGIDYLKQNPKAFPDLILVDFEMPDYNGLEFIDYYEKKFWPNFQDTMMVVSSNLNLSRVRQLFKNNKCVDLYLSKPIDFRTWNRIKPKNTLDHSES
ncbi:MAG: response regulator [Candidatus Cyclobacteriaceae bacterium M3_2C_046]